MATQDKLEIIRPNGEIEFYELEPGGITNIGRHPENDIVITSPGIAPFHAVIEHRRLVAGRAHRIKGLPTGCLQTLGWDGRCRSFRLHPIHEVGPGVLADEPVVLSNVPADALSARASAAIEAYVKGGGTFLMAGGDASPAAIRRPATAAACHRIPARRSGGKTGRHIGNTGRFRALGLRHHRHIPPRCKTGSKRDLDSVAPGDLGNGAAQVR